MSFGLGLLYPATFFSTALVGESIKADGVSSMVIIESIGSEILIYPC